MFNTTGCNTILIIIIVLAAVVIFLLIWFRKPMVVAMTTQQPIGAPQIERMENLSTLKSIDGLQQHLGKLEHKVDNALIKTQVPQPVFEPKRTGPQNLIGADFFELQDTQWFGDANGIPKPYDNRTDLSQCQPCICPKTQ